MPAHESHGIKIGVNEDAVTGLGILILLVIILTAGIYVTFNVLATPLPPARHIGLLPAAVRLEETQLNVYGTVAGFSAVNGPVGATMVWRTNASPDRLGGIGTTLSVFTGGDGGIDMAGTAILWNDRSGTEAIPMTRTNMVICPNWTIVYRHNIDPAKPADADDVLEPGELFDIFACPSKTYAPYETFTVEFDPPGSGPHFPVACTVPFPIKPVMEL